jgi:hypothetical protein
MDGGLQCGTEATRNFYIGGTEGREREKEVRTKGTFRVRGLENERRGGGGGDGEGQRK